MWTWEPLNRFGQNIHPATLDWNRNPLYKQKADAMHAAFRCFPKGVIVDEGQPAPKPKRVRSRRR